MAARAAQNRDGDCGQVRPLEPLCLSGWKSQMFWVMSDAIRTPTVVDDVLIEW